MYVARMTFYSGVTPSVLKALSVSINWYSTFSKVDALTKVDELSLLNLSIELESLMGGAGLS